MLRHHDEGAPRYQMREKLLSIGDDSWIEDEHGTKVFKVNGKAMRIRDTFVLEDPQGNEVAKIQERKLHVRDTMAIERGDAKLATVHKRIVGLRDHLKVDLENGDEWKVHGNLVDHEYEIEAHHGTIAEISKKWFRVRDTYGVEIAPDQDVPLILAVTVAVEDMTHERG
ncbi:MAG: LURP-one-related/scramblase family protein [Planctomycetaceae bacterium]